MRSKSTQKYILSEATKYYLTEDDAAADMVEEEEKEGSGGAVETSVWTKDGYKSSDVTKSWEELFKMSRSTTGGVNGSWERMSRDQLWDKYYSVVWGDGKDTLNDTAKKIKALGNPFQQELMQLGFKKASNPFLVFVETTIKSSDFKDTGLFTEKTFYYTAIHNAFTSGYISKKDLTDSGSPSLIWWPASYNKTYTANGSALLQRLAATTDNRVSAMITQLNSIEIEGITLDITREKFLAGVFSATCAFTVGNDDSEADTLKSLAEKINGCKPAEVDKKTIKSEANIKEILNVLENASGIKAAGNKKKKAGVTPENIQKLWTDTLKAAITNKDNMTKLLGYLITCEDKPDVGTKIITDASIPFNKDSVVLSITDLSLCHKWFDGFDLSSDKQINELIKGLLALDEVKALYGITA
jgi:hypothetical protein